MKIKKSSKNKVKVNKVGGMTFSVILAVYSVSIILLYLFAMLISVKSSLDLQDKVISLPNPKFGWKWKNFATAFDVFYVPITTKAGPRNVYLWELFYNSILYALGCALVSAAVHFVTAYVVCRFNRMKICKIIFNVVIVVMVIPIYGSLPAELKMARSLGIYDSILGQWVMKMSFLGTYFLIFYSGIKTLGGDYAEAAAIDGAGPMVTMIKIYLPMISSVFIGITILEFISYWQDYVTPMYYMPSYPVVSYALNYMSYNTLQGITIPTILAASILSAIPSLVIFICFRDRIMGNMTFGGLKG